MPSSESCGCRQKSATWGAGEGDETVVGNETRRDYSAYLGNVIGSHLQCLPAHVPLLPQFQIEALKPVLLSELLVGIERENFLDEDVESLIQLTISFAAHELALENVTPHFY